jgi:hypothetical protein
MVAWTVIRIEVRVPWVYDVNAHEGGSLLVTDEERARLDKTKISSTGGGAEHEDRSEIDLGHPSYTRSIKVNAMES